LTVGAPSGEYFITAGTQRRKTKTKEGVSNMENTVEFDDIEFIETSAELLATSYYVNIQ
jgi:hypothetical protein